MKHLITGGDLHVRLLPISNLEEILLKAPDSALTVPSTKILINSFIENPLFQTVDALALKIGKKPSYLGNRSSIIRWSNKNNCLVLVNTVEINGARVQAFEVTRARGRCGFLIGGAKLTFLQR